MRQHQFCACVSGVRGGQLSSDSVSIPVCGMVLTLACRLLLGTVTQTAWNLTVGTDQLISVSLRHMGTLYQTGYCTATCSEVNVAGTDCGRCATADAHLSLNGTGGWFLFG